MRDALVRVVYADATVQRPQPVVLVRGEHDAIDDGRRLGERRLERGRPRTLGHVNAPRAARRKSVPTRPPFLPDQPRHAHAPAL